MSARDGEQALAAALVELLASSPAAIARLLELVEAGRSPTIEPSAPAYTVASLAAALNVSARVVRGAIARGELRAAKRGGRWIISIDAVHAWAQLDEPERQGRPLGRRGGSRRPLGSAMALLPGAIPSRRPL